MSASACDSTCHSFHLNPSAVQAVGYGAKYGSGFFNGSLPFSLPHCLLFRNPFTSQAKNTEYLDTVTIGPGLKIKNQSIGVAENVSPMVTVTVMDVNGLPPIARIQRGTGSLGSSFPLGSSRNLVHTEFSSSELVLKALP